VNFKNISNKKKRGNYRCSKCGMLKKGHQCKILEILNQEFKHNWDSLSSKKKDHSNDNCYGSKDLEEEREIRDDHGIMTSYKETSTDDSSVEQIDIIAKCEESECSSEHSPHQNIDYSVLTPSSGNMYKESQCMDQSYSRSLEDTDNLIYRLAGLPTQNKPKIDSMTHYSSSELRNNQRCNPLPSSELRNNQRCNSLPLHAYYYEEPKQSYHDLISDLNRYQEMYNYRYCKDFNQCLRPDLIPRSSYNKDLYSRYWNGVPESIDYQEYVNSGYHY